MFYAAMIGVVVTMVLALIRAGAATVYDRILALNMFGTKTILLIAISGFLYGKTSSIWRWCMDL